MLDGVDSGLDRGPYPFITVRVGCNLQLGHMCFIDDGPHFLDGQLLRSNAVTN